MADPDMDKQNKLLADQNTILSEQNSLLKRLAEVMDRQNDLLDQLTLANSHPAVARQVQRQAAAARAASQE